MNEKKENISKSAQTKKSNSTKSKSTVPKKTVAKSKSTQKSRNAVTKGQKVAKSAISRKPKAVIKDDNTAKEIINTLEETKLDKTSIINPIKIEPSSKIEDSKYYRRKNKTLISIGIFIATLGLVALILTLIANRIIDREFISDSSVVLMTIISLLIEGFGAFIIINET